MIYCCDSVSLNIQSSYQNLDEIMVFTQFFVHSSPERNEELRFCLRKNVENHHISRIFLLNEAIYSDEELGITSDKIIQVNIGKRLFYEHIFYYVNDPTNGVCGYVVIVNSDIFLDDTIKMLRYSDIHSSRKMCALLRWEYEPEPETEGGHIYGPNGDSQDTWIYHTNNKILPEAEKIFKFSMGVPGCDNKMIYAIHISGFQIVNDPNTIKTWHYHKTNLRSYDNTNRLKRPYGIIYPVGYDARRFEHFAKMEQISYYDNDKLFEYITKKCNQKRKFIIPRLHTVEANMMYLYYTYNDAIKKRCAPETYQQIEEKMKLQLGLMKKYTGVRLSNMEDVNAFSVDYLMSIEKCELYGTWSRYDSHTNTQIVDNFIQQIYPNKPCFWGGVMDVFHYVYSNPWTHSLKNSKILLICPFKENVEAQIHIRKEIYGVDLFPDCSFTVLSSPAKYENVSSRNYFVELKEMYKQIDRNNKSYDIALIAAGGYSTPLANYIYDCGKSAIVVGDALLMYFGLYDKRLMKERSDIFRIYLNDKWIPIYNLEKENVCDFPHW